MKVVDIAEQYAIYDGKPNFMPLGAAIYLINHYAYGGSEQDMRDAKEDGLENPKRYKVQLVLKVEEIPQEEGALLEDIQE